MQLNYGGVVKGIRTRVQGETPESAEAFEGRPVTEAERPLAMDHVFEILKNQRRRFVLHYLADADERVSLGELSTRLAGWENEKAVGRVTSSERKRVYVGLYQCHLPKMDGMDVVAFDKPRGVIEPAENYDLVYSYIDGLEHPGDTG